MGWSSGWDDAASVQSLQVLGLTASRAVATDASKNLVSVANTGTGSNVLATSPTLVTPALGTPSAAVLTNATGLPLTTGVTGTLPVANGGTGVTSSTGTGNVVLSASPTLTGTIGAASQTLSGTLEVTGKVGMGTTVTSTKLDIYDPASGGTDDLLHVRDYLGGVSDKTRLIIKNGGNIGIGTDSPSYKLDVNGTVRVSGNIINSTIKSGATQVAAGAAAGELWKTASHATLPDNVVMIGV